MLILILLFLLAQDPECQWKPIMAKVDSEAQKLQIQQPKITDQKFYDWMQRRIKKARTEHTETCTVIEHMEPEVLKGCDPLDSTCKYLLTPTINAFLTPRSWYWEMRARHE